MNYRLFVTLLSVALLLSLAACESTGTIVGRSAQGDPVALDYQQGFMDSAGTLKLTMADGERFEGKFVQHSSTHSSDAVIIGESSRDDSILLGDGSSTSSLAKALLLGDRGSSMECEFQLAEPRWGIKAGGIGSCASDDGREIKMSF
ncbi:MAG: hypothetical protein OIF35_01905 [Cellvibrionaceae bacterium]|nr:hypothetical protein [Cellvibrionaceae bacterium]MCV6625249.1 hypothetical protein [Cellvibrionaceae bacterium]